MSAIYIVVPTDSVTEAMKNNSKRDFSSKTFRTSIDGSKTLIKVKSPVIPALHDFAWYDQSEILDVLNQSEWQDGI